MSNTGATSRAIRVENLPASTNPADLLTLFQLDDVDREKLTLKSLAPAVGVHSEDPELVATLVTGGDLDVSDTGLRLDDAVVDLDFHGFTPLTAPPEPLLEYVEPSMGRVSDERAG